MPRPVAAAPPGQTRNLAALWQTYRAAGTQCLIAVGPVENDAAARAYAAALPRAAITLCRLHAGAGALRIDTDRLTVEETADVIAARTGWPRPAGPAVMAAGGPG